MAATHTPARFLSGEAGIGKSTALRGSADKHAGPVFRGRLPANRTRDPLRSSVPLLQSITRQTLPGTAVSRASVRDAVLELQFALEHSTMNAAPLVQIDDLHWADEASLNAIPYLVERHQDFPVRREFAARSAFHDAQRASGEIRFRRPGNRKIDCAACAERILARSGL